MDLWYFVSISEIFDARSTVVSAEINPCSPKMSSTIFFVSLSFIPTLFFRYHLKFSPKCLVQNVNFESGKLDLTKAFSSSVPITMSFVLSKDVSISVPKTEDKCVKNLWYVWNAPSQWRYRGPSIIGFVFLPFRRSFFSWNTVVVTKHGPKLKVLSTSQTFSMQTKNALTDFRYNRLNLVVFQ